MSGMDLRASALTQVSCPTHPLWISHHTMRCGGLGLQNWKWFGSCVLCASTHLGWAVYRILCEDMSLNEEKKKISLDVQENMVNWRRLVKIRSHLGYCSLHQTPSYPRSSWQSLYWVQWQSRALSVYWSSGSLSGHPLCRSKMQLLFLKAAGRQTLGMNSELTWNKMCTFSHHLSKTLQHFHSRSIFLPFVSLIS